MQFIMVLSTHGVIAGYFLYNLGPPTYLQMFLAEDRKQKVYVNNVEILYVCRIAIFCNVFSILMWRHIEYIQSHDTM